MGNLRYLDLFAGAGGLSEGFIQAGFLPVAHVEADKGACNTLRTRACYHYLKACGDVGVYQNYLLGKITRAELYSAVPSEILEATINGRIGPDNDRIFSQIDAAVASAPIDIIVGGPPCQAYSVVGRAPLKSKNDDIRTSLYLEYGRYLKRYDPKVFVFENVPGLMSASGGIFFRNLQKYYRRLGYCVEAKTINAINHRVIQNRKRVIIIGWKKGLDFSYPNLPEVEPAHYRDEIFADLPPIHRGAENRVINYRTPINDYLASTEIRNCVTYVTQHTARDHNHADLAIYKLAIEQLASGVRLKNDAIPAHMRTQKNVTDFLDRFKVVGDIPHTVIAHLGKDGHHYIHPDPTQLRSLSVREAARIQSFPDDYFFEGVKEGNCRSLAFRQIGNAVPPLLAKQIATEIKDQFRHGL